MQFIHAKGEQSRLLQGYYGNHVTRFPFDRGNLAWSARQILESGWLDPILLLLGICGFRHVPVGFHALCQGAGSKKPSLASLFLKSSVFLSFLLSYLAFQICFLPGQPGALWMKFLK